VLVIGGGLTGVAIARETARRGLQTLLVERQFIGASATAAWHGLLTDASQGDDPLRTTPALRRERARLLTAAPHLIRPLALIIPDWQTDPWPRTRRLASLLWAELQGTPGNLRSAARRNKRDILLAEPALRARSLGGGLAVRSWTANGTTLALAIARSAALAGAQIATHAAAEAFVYADGRLVGATIVDGLDGNTYTLHAGVTIFAGGAEAPPDARAIDPESGLWCRRIALPQQRLDVQGSLLFTSALDGSEILAQREGDLVIAGPVRPVAAADDSLGWVTALLRGLNAALPTARLSHGDVLGVRAARVATGEDTVRVRDDGLVHAVTSRPTAVRAFASSTADRITALLQQRTGRTALHAVAPAVHESLPGGDAYDTSPIMKLGLEADLAPDTVAHCVATCGTEAAAIFNLAQRDRALRARMHPDAPAILAEVAYAVRRSFAVTV